MHRASTILLCSNTKSHFVFGVMSVNAWQKMAWKQIFPQVLAMVWNLWSTDEHLLWDEMQFPIICTLFWFIFASFFLLNFETLLYLLTTQQHEMQIHEIDLVVVQFHSEVYMMMDVDNDVSQMYLIRNLFSSFVNI